MLTEGTIIGSYMLTRFLCQSPLAEVFQSLHVEAGERYLTKVARTEWEPLADRVAVQGFDFFPGRAERWKPPPSALLERELAVLKKASKLSLALPRVVEEGQWDGRRFASFEFFPGETLETLMRNGARLSPAVVISLLEQADRCLSSGFFHGNIQPASILVGEESVLLLDSMMAAAEFADAGQSQLVRCVTAPAYYPFLDPRHDQLALGILLYEIATGKHPLLDRQDEAAPAVRRRAGEALKRVIDEARERGANRYLSPLLSLVRPSALKRKIPSQMDDMIARTMGLARMEAESRAERVEVVPGSWLDLWSRGERDSLESAWRLADTADAIRREAKDPARKRRATAEFKSAEGAAAPGEDARTPFADDPLSSRPEAPTS